MNIGITGASGFIGRQIVELALRRGHEVIAFSRSPEKTVPGCEMRAFSLEKGLDISGCEALIHLAGESVIGLWTAAKQNRIRESRVQGTRAVVNAINSAANPPEVLVCGSAIGFYGDGGEKELTEADPAGTGFLAETTAGWEAEAQNANRCRVVCLRTAIVLGNEGGALPVMKALFRTGLAGPIASGRQWMSWIHIQDQTRLALFAVENLDLQGPVNASAPWPVRNADFTATLARKVRRPAFLRVPAFALRALGEFRHELLDSKRVLPATATAHDFGFRFPELGPALDQLIP